jgi:hypothetical protein
VADDWSADRHVDLMAPLLGLAVTEAQRPGVCRFLEVARRMAALVEPGGAGDSLDLAPVFRPIEPASSETAPARER